MEIVITPVGDINPNVIGAAEDALRTHCLADVTTAEPVPVAELPIAPAGAPYAAEAIVASVEEPADDTKRLLVTRLAITHDDREFVFGVADQGGQTALVSTYKLFQTADGDGRPDPDHALARVRKEVVHEVGHTFGQRHCDTADCVMNFSLTLTAVDEKSEQFCAECAADVATVASSMS